MYALIHNNKVIVGPKEWNSAFFATRLREYDIVVTIPRKAPETLPYVINENTKIVPAEIVREEAQDYVQYNRGPLWTINENSATALYEAVDQPIDMARQNLSRLAAAERYKKENSGTTTTLQSQEVTLDTSREGRNIFFQKYLLMGDLDTATWKFPEGWFTINKAELGQVVLVGSSHIQGAFDWEANINTQLDAATTKAELLTVLDLIIPPPEEEGV